MAPWRNNAIKYGYQSSAGFPLSVSGMVVGNLNIYSAEKYFFTSEEEKLITGVIYNLSQALDYINLEIEKENTTAALAESEERLRLSIASGKQGLYDLDIRTGQATVNEAYAAMLGYDPNNFHENNDLWISRLHPDDKEKATKLFFDYTNGIIPEYKLEFRLLTSEGKWKWILSTGNIVAYDENGKPSRMLGTHTDIDDLKQAEQNLTERVKEMTCISAIRLEMMKEQPIDLFCEKALHYIVKGMQYPSAALPVITYNDKVYRLQDINYETLKYIEAPIITLGNVTGNLKVYYNNRNLQFIEPEEIELINNVAASIGMFVTNSLTSQQLKENLKILKEAQQVARIGHYVYDIKTQQWECSAVIDDMLGLEPNFERSFNNWLHKLIAPSFRNSIKNQLNDLKQTRGVFKLDFAGIHQQTGNEIWVAITGRFERDEKDNITKLVGTVQDITDRKRNEAIIESTNNQLTTTLAAIPDLMFELDIEGVYLNVHATKEDLLYRQKDTLIGKTVYQLLPPDAAELSMIAIHEANSKGFSNGTQIKLPVPAGICWFELSIAKKITKENEKASFIVLSRDITDRKLSEEKITAERNILRAVIDNIPDFIFVTDTNCKHIINNTALLKALGATSEAETLQKSMDEYYPKEIADTFLNDDKKVLETGEPVINREEKIINLTTGKMDWLLTNKLPLKNAKDEIIGVVGISRVITERHQLQLQQELIRSIIQALGTSEKLQDGLTTALQLISKELNVGLSEAWLPNSDETELRCYAQWGIATITEKFKYDKHRNFAKGVGLPGYVWETGQSKYWDNIQDNEQVRRKELFAAANLNCSIAIPVIFRNKVIAVFSFFFHSMPVNIVGIIETLEKIALQIAMDIQRKKAELELAAFFEFSPDLLCVANEKGYFVKVNPAFSKTLGYTSEELMAQPFTNFVHPEDRYPTVERTDYAVKKQSDHFENRYLTKDGKVVWLSWTSAPLPDDNLAVAVAKDVTQLKENELQLKLLNKEISSRVDELAASNAELEQFAYVASHDLQEPLRMVSSFMTLLETKYKDQLDDKAKQYIHFAVDGAIRMRKIILDLLEYSRVGRIVPPSENVNLNNTMEDIVTLLKETIAENKAMVTWDNLPTVFMAKTSAQQLLQNLISNAIKYRQLDVNPIVNISAEETETHWKISVKDNGIGIDPKYYDKIFVLFQRLHGKSEYSGTGIGLAVCKKIVQLYKGEINVASSPGNGSIFYFTIGKTQ